VTRGTGAFSAGFPDFQLEMANERGPPALAAIVLLLLLAGRSGESKSMSKIKSKKEGTFG
jgi:hypothetical protein